MRKLFFALSIVPFVACLAFRLIDAMSYASGCEQHLARAGQADAIEPALQELAIALEYIERRGWTHGHTAIFEKRGENDVGRWYARIDAAYRALASTPASASGQERQHRLWEARARLLSDSGSVRAPPGISAHPHNREYFAGFVAFGLLGTLAALGLLREHRRLTRFNAVLAAAVFGACIITFSQI